MTGEVKPDLGRFLQLPLLELILEFFNIRDP